MVQRRQQQNHVENDEVKATFQGVGYAVSGVKHHGAGLRHDRAIELIDAAARGIRLKALQDHWVSRRRGHSDGPPMLTDVLSFGLAGLNFRNMNAERSRA